MNQEASQAPGNGYGEETPSAAAHWLERAVPEDAVLGEGPDAMPLREHPQLRKYGSVAEMAKSLLHAQSLVGRKAVGLVRPADGAGEEEWSAFRADLRRAVGVPDDPAGYDIALPEGLEPDGPLLDWFRGAAHGAGLSPEQVQDLSDRYVGWLADSSGRWNAERSARRDETLRELGGRWGGDAEANMERARRGFEHYAEKAGLDRAMRDALLAAHGDDPVLIRLFHGVGTAMAEDDFVLGDAGPLRPDEAMSPERFFAEEVFGGKGE